MHARHSRTRHFQPWAARMAPRRRSRQGRLRSASAMPYFPDLKIGAYLFLAASLLRSWLRRWNLRGWRLSFAIAFKLPSRGLSLKSLARFKSQERVGIGNWLARRISPMKNQICVLLV